MTPLAAIVGLLAAAGCGTSSPAPQVTVTVTSAPSVSGAASSPHPSSQAHANAPLLVSALASGSSASLLSARKLVAGPAMIRYIRFQVIYAEAAEESGQPGVPGSVSVVPPGSYQLCYPQGQGCQSFTAFQVSKSGRITGMDVDGQPIAARLAAGPSDRGHGLVLADVTSYLFTSTGQVGVAFHVRNTSNNGVSTLGFQPVFATSPGDARLSPDLSSSTVNSTQPLQPGQSALSSPSSTPGPSRAPSLCRATAATGCSSSPGSGSQRPRPLAEARTSA
jgi:hypothetical protein